MSTLGCRRGWSPAALLLALAVFGFSLPEARAIKREPSLEAAGHPAVVLVTARDARGSREGNHCGVLLGPRAVLTAAHCVLGFDSWSVSAPYAKRGPVQATAKLARVHPGFKPGSFGHDLAVLILDQAIDLGHAFPTLAGGELFPLDAKLLVVGRVNNGKLSQTQLFLAQISLVEIPNDLHLYGGHPQVVEKGDSGGPLLVAGNNEIAAVVSGRIGFRRGNVPTDVYIPVGQKDKQWILQQVAEK